ncbi:MAG TPA: FkbM family methyltransferase [Thermoanaerobaculia bacterium]|nr:FkbM family methyltransferase [Thermoanaerobaculia bacterium]
MRSSVVLMALRAARWLDRSGLRRLRPVQRLVSIARRQIFPAYPDLPGRSAVVSLAGIDLRVPHETAGPYSRNGFEPLTARAVESLIRPGAVVVDVGANVGFHTVRMARRAGPTGRVHALEPAADNLAYLRHNLARNLDDAQRAAVTVVPVAAAAERGLRDFFLQSKGTHHGFFDRSDVRGDRMTVETAPLDDLVKGPVDFVKIDTEGAEMEVLDGMSRILAESPDLQIVAEWNLPLSSGSTAGAETAELDALPRRLEGLGFTVTVLDEGEGVAITVDEVLTRLQEGTFGRPRVVNLLARRAPRRLRVLHLIKGLGRGGAERLLVDGLRRADRERFEYAYGYFLPAKDQLARELEALGAPVQCFDARTCVGVFLKVPAVRRFLEDWGADLVHCHLPVSGVAGRLAAGRLGMPVIYTEYNLIERYHPATRWANLATWGRQGRVVAVSEEVAGSIRRHAGEAVPVEVVVNGVDCGRFRPDAELRRRARGDLGLPPEAPVIGQVAVFRSQKRLDLWLEAAARVRAERPEARFVLVGDGPERRAVERRAERLGLGPGSDGALQLAGLQEDVRPFYAALDLFLVSSDYEGLPVALLEAMASGLPGVYTAVGGVPEVVRDGVEGLLVPPGDPEALAAAVLRLLGEPGERARLGASARERVAESFSTERMTRRLEAIYQEVAGERR